MGPSGDTGAGVRTYTVTELHEQAELIVDTLNESGRPALITQNGRFVALLSPLSAVPVESILLQRAVSSGWNSEVASVMGEDPQS